MKMDIRNAIYVITEDKKMIYKIVSVEEVDSVSYGLTYMLELVAGYDYINPDYSNTQGYVSAEGFTDSVQWDSFTVYPMEETLGERLKEEDYELINIADYKIHPFNNGEDEEEK